MLANLPQTSLTLLKAADLVREKGWWQCNEGEYSPGSVCISNAIAYFTPDTVCQHIVMEYLGLKSLTALFAWNDDPDRTKEEVIAALEGAAALAAR